MIFGSVPLSEAQGAILAHSIRAGGVLLKKGVLLTAGHCAALAEAGVGAVTVARLRPDDMGEDEAARSIAAAAGADHLRRADPTTGRCNLYARSAGLLRVRSDAVNAANAVDEALTLATPPDFARLEAGQLAATAKVIPYAVSRASLDAVTLSLREGGDALRLVPFRPLDVALVVTRTPGQKDSVVEKGIKAVQNRLLSLGSPVASVALVEHDEAALGAALGAAMRSSPDLLLILGGSATSDRLDTAPAALAGAGGTIERFGMPVDPGNLLVLGRIAGVPAVILPGCARSPALNGADWVLERIAAGIAVTSADIAAMGVGGLLKEMPGRPHPREKPAP